MTARKVDPHGSSRPPAVVLCGGRGRRLQPLTDEVPKPMVRIDDRPLVVHIMENFSRYGVTDFVLCTGYLSREFYDYFEDSENYEAEEFDEEAGDARFVASDDRNWNVRLVDTGRTASKSERLLRAREHLRPGRFFVTYGDGLADINVAELVDRHRTEGRTATVTGVRAPLSFGVLETEGARVQSIEEKPLTDKYINVGFFVFEERIFDYLTSGRSLERGVLNELASNDMLTAYTHDGFFKGVDTMKDLDEARELLAERDDPPWVSRT